jgi:alpha-tubulin suppressor-like RCC1 family protein
MVYTWGYGGSGQLGHGDTDFSTVPRLVTTIQDEPIAMVAAGAAFTVALTSTCHLNCFRPNCNAICRSRKRLN